MKKIIPTIFATVLAISSVSLLIGCDQGPPVDPDAAKKQAEEGTMEDEKLTPEEKTEFEGAIKPPPEVPAPKN